MHIVQALIHLAKLYIPEDHQEAPKPLVLRFPLVDAKIESFMDNVILVFEKPACAAVWEIGEIMSALQCRYFRIIFQES